MLQSNFQKNKVVSGKILFFMISPFCTPHPICRNISFSQGSLLWKCCTFNSSTLN